jgi:hypothetical protein
VSYVLFAALLAHAIAHVAIVVALIRQRAFKRAALAFFLPPLAPHWGWRAGLRAHVYTWLGALAIYAIGVALS